MRLVEIKDFNALINNKPFFDQPIGIDLSRQTNMSISQQINFVGKLEEDDGPTMFFITEKQQKTILNFSLDSLTVVEKYE